MIPERHETSCWTVHIDEETGKAHWVGAGTGDMGETTFDAGEPLIVHPDHFPPSTYISVDEPTDDKGFYDKLFEKRGQKWPRWIPQGGPATKVIAELLIKAMNEKYTNAYGGPEPVKDTSSFDLMILGGFMAGAFSVGLAKEFLKEQGFL